MSRTVQVSPLGDSYGDAGGLYGALCGTISDTKGVCGYNSLKKAGIKSWHDVCITLIARRLSRALSKAAHGKDQALETRA